MIRFPRFGGGQRALAARIGLSCCGTSDFVALSPTLSPAYDGLTVFKGETTGGLYLCAHCGRAHGLSAMGGYDPHPDVLPAHLAVLEHQRRMLEQQAKDRANGTGQSRGGRVMPRARGWKDPED